MPKPNHLSGDVLIMPINKNGIRCVFLHQPNNIRLTSIIIDFEDGSVMEWNDHFDYAFKNFDKLLKDVIANAKEMVEDNDLFNSIAEKYKCDGY